MNIAKYKKRIIYSLTSLLGLFALFYIITHGFINIEGDNIADVSYQKLPDADKKTGSDSIFTSSGSYFISVTTDSGDVFTKVISVPYFLQSTTITIDVKEGTLSILSSKSNSFAGSITKGFVRSFDYSAATLQNTTGSLENTTVANSLPSLSDFTYLSPSVIAGYYRSETTISPVIYDITTNTPTVYPPIPLQDGDTSVGLSKVNDSSFVLFTKSTGVALYSKNTPNVASKVLKLSNYNVASFDNKSLITASGDRVAILEGADQTLSPDSDTETPEQDKKVNDFSINVLNFNGQLEQKIKINEPLIKNVVLSSDGKLLALSTNDSFKIIRLSDKKEVYSAPFSIDDVRWLNTNELLFSTNDDHDLYRLSVDSKVAKSLFSPNTINISEISYVDQNKVLFTGYSQNDAYSKQPNLYLLDIAVISKDYNAFIKNIPKQGDGYRVDLVGNIIHVNLTRYTDTTGVFYDDNAKASANEFIKKYNTGNKYTVQEDYVDLDLR